MSYNSQPIAGVVDDINEEYLLPAIQREFVWDRDQIIRLFDSLLQDYPIGSFLFWHIPKDDKDQYVKYEFIKDYITDDRYIETNAQTRNSTTDADGLGDVTLVLDGQQRLSSLFIGLQGTYTDKEKYKHYDNPDAWRKRRLYLNLLSDPEDTTEGRLRLQYEFDFLASHSETINSSDNYWFRAGRILDITEDRELDQLIRRLKEEYPDSLSGDEEFIIQHNVSQLYRAVHEKPFINYFNEDTQNLDRVLEIFIRTNEGGTQLTKSDLLLSLATANWDRKNAREEITNFVDTLNKQLDNRNNFNKDFVLKASLVLTNLPVRYRVESFNENNVTTIEDEWESIKSAVERAVKLINRFGVNEDNLTSRNAVIPIAYYFKQNPAITLEGNSRPDARTRRRIQRWFLTALLNGTFSGNSDRVLRAIRELLREEEDELTFPLEAINAELRSQGRLVGFSEETIENVLLYEKGGSRTFLALTLMYEPRNWGTLVYHQDHIFPRSKLESESLEEQGFSEEEISKFKPYRDRLANLQLLTETENTAKQDKSFKDWIRSRDDAFYDEHLIPKNRELFSLENFDRFAERREELIKNKLIDILE